MFRSYPVFHKGGPQPPPPSTPDHLRVFINMSRWHGVMGGDGGGAHGGQWASRADDRDWGRMSELFDEYNDFGTLRGAKQRHIQKYGWGH